MNFKKALIVFLPLFVLLSLGFLNLGKWLDVTQKPVKSDLVVCLGGGTLDRVKKSIELFEKGYANKFLLLGESWYNQPYIKKNYPNLVVKVDESSKNTKEEITFLIDYMKTHKYKSAIIVTDPPHSRRVKSLISLVHILGDENITFSIVASDVKWWNAENYYKNQRAKKFVWYESLKTIASYFLYW
jgi:uncharacterized SAM-binding protein YcdF (DUF218 family)